MAHTPNMTAPRKRRNTFPSYTPPQLYAATDLFYPHTLPPYLISTLHDPPALPHHLNQIEDLASSTILTVDRISAFPKPWQLVLRTVIEQNFKEADHMTHVFAAARKEDGFGRMPVRLRVALEWLRLRRVQTQMRRTDHEAPNPDYDHNPHKANSSGQSKMTRHNNMCKTRKRSNLILRQAEQHVQHVRKVLRRLQFKISLSRASRNLDVLPPDRALKPSRNTRCPTTG